MFQYRAHGCTIESTAPIPDLSPAKFTASPDLRIIFGAAPIRDDEPGERWFESPVLLASRFASGGFRLEYRDGPVFTIDQHANTIWAADPATSSFADICSYLLGPVIGIMLRLRGVLCLHASAVTIDGRGFAFVGFAGAGKSTMAAAFAGAGYKVLSDDTLTVRPEGASWIAAPGYPRLRLWSDAVSALAIPVAAGDDARRVHVDIAVSNCFATEPVPVAAVYFIDFADGADRPCVEPVPAAEALAELSANTFASRVLTRDQRAAEFTALADLLRAVPARRLTRPVALHELGAVRDVVLEDVATAVAAV